MDFPVGVKYQRPKEVYLFGGGPVMVGFAQWLTDRGIPVSVYTAPRHADELLRVLRYRGLVHVRDDINQERWELKGTSDALAITFGPAWRFGPAIREAFGDRLLDFMSIPFPSYLGGAHTTHAILRGERHWGACLQLVTERTVQGEVHDGDIVFSRDWILPIAVDHTCMDKDHELFLQDFIRLIEAEHRFMPIAADRPSANIRQTFPRLNTDVNGWIDWTWSAHHIIRFIQAFDAPYSGAKTYCLARQFTLHKASPHTGDIRWHPFHAGIVLDRQGNDLTIAAPEGCIRALCFDSFIKPGMRLHTPREVLDRALAYSPSYTAVGDANAV